jgi:hypothetical protein
MTCMRGAVPQTCIENGVLCVGNVVILRPSLYAEPEPEPTVTWQQIANPKDVNSVEVTDSSCYTFPDLIHVQHPDVEIVRLKNSGLASVAYYELFHLKKLREFDVSENRLTKLDSNLFDDNRDLEVINFSGNRIAKIGYNLLIPLVKLRDAKFFRNVCADVAMRGSFDNLMLKLRGNCKQSENMWIEDIHYMTARVEQLEAEIAKRDGKTPAKVRCNVNKMNLERGANCLSIGNYRPFEQRPIGLDMSYSEVRPVERDESVKGK